MKYMVQKNIVIHQITKICFLLTATLKTQEGKEQNTNIMSMVLYTQTKHHHDNTQY